MKLRNRTRKAIASFFIGCAIFLSVHARDTQDTPRLTVIFIIDQFAYHYIPRLEKYFTAGLKTLCNDGVIYHNAYMPHGMTATATGHAGLSTGAYAKDHGFIGNRWFDTDGKDVHCDDDSAGRAAVFATPTTFYKYGKSAHQLMVDGLSDQFMLQATPENPRVVYSLSLKSRAAIATASKMGKALWYDLKTGHFTSSKAYFGAFPAWVNEFNSKNPWLKKTTVEWKPRFKLTSPAYASVNRNTYRFVQGNKQLVGTTIPVKYQEQFRHPTDEPQPPYNLFAHTPAANEMLLSLAQECVKTHLLNNPKASMLLWVCVSSTDKIGHWFGPNSYEAVDMLYHLDVQLGSFMKFLDGTLGSGRTLYALSADHGICPIVELLEQQGLTQARRVFISKFVPEMNKLIEEKHGIAGIVQKYKTPQFYVDMKKLNSLDKKKQKAIIKDLREFLERQPGIKQTWTFKELHNATFKDSDLANFFKQQLFKGRSGLITLQTYPYSLDTKWPYGTDHRTPYDYDTHVPLIIYQPEIFEKKSIDTRVWALQLANTLAYILGIERPSASTFDLLPGLFDPISPAP